MIWTGATRRFALIVGWGYVAYVTMPAVGSTIAAVAL